MNFEPDKKDLLKAIPELKHLSDKLQDDILEFAIDQFNNGHEDGVEDAEDDEKIGIKRAYQLFEDVENWDEFVEKRKELFNRTLSGL